MNYSKITQHPPIDTPEADFIIVVALILQATHIYPWHSHGLIAIWAQGQWSFSDFNVSFIFTLPNSLSSKDFQNYNVRNWHALITRVSYKAHKSNLLHLLLEKFSPALCALPQIMTSWTRKKLKISEDPLSCTQKSITLFLHSILHLTSKIYK